jgi:hypothetical protein
VYGDVDVRIRRLRACGCRAGEAEPNSFAAMFPPGGVAPEFAYITAKFAALVPFARCRVDPNSGLVHFWCKAWGPGPTKLLKLLLDRVCRLVCSDVGAVCGRRRDFDERG